MDREQKIAYINSQIVCAQAEISGMEAENAYDEKNKIPPSFMKNDFMAIPEKYGITHNAVLRYLVD